MKTKASRKNFFMAIKKSPGRFLSILFIVALGTSFFSGVRASEPDMRVTADTYYDRSDLGDIKAYSTYGVTEDEVKKFSEIEGIKEAEGRYAMDFLSSKGDKQYVLHIFSLLPTMNQIEVKEGKLPQKEGECLVDSSMNYKIGDKIHLSLEGKEKVLDSLKTDELTVVGVGDSPEYISFNRGNTTIGTGVIQGFCVVAQETFDMEAFTEVYLQVEGAKDEMAYTDAYDDLIDDKIDSLEKDTKEFGKERYQEIQDEAIKTLEKEEKKANKEIAKARTELEDGAKALADGKKEIEDGEAALNAAKAELAAKEAELNDGINQYNDGRNALNEGIAEYERGREEYEATRQASEPLLAQGEVELRAARDELDRLWNTYQQLVDAGQTQEAEVLKGEAEKGEESYQIEAEKINQGRKQLEDANLALEAAAAEIQDNAAMLNETSLILEDGKAQLEAGKVELGTQEKVLQDAKATLEEKEKELLDGTEKLEKEEKKAKNEIKKAKKEIEDLKEPKWYVEDRSVFPDYTGYGDNAIRIGKIGRVFPAIFFLVAALVSLTTMTRLVEEERTQIGTFKALGYSRGAIAFKYIGYALLATVSGSIFGVLIGEKIFPYIIIHAYKMMYQTLPDVIVPYNLYLGVYATVIAVFSTLLATGFSCYKELREKPAILMRPPAPKKGTRVFLERVTFIWKRLNFTWKSTIRNLLRYKKRFFMTVFGIGACMALLMTGFGLRDSIFDITKIQYSDIQLFDGQGIYKDDTTKEERDELHDLMKEEGNIKESMDAYLKNIELKNGKEKWETYLFVPENLEEITHYVHFRNRVTHKEYQLDKDTVILTEKAAKELGVQVGDTVTIKGVDGELKVGNIAENYLGHYIYCSPTLYQKLYNEEPTYNTLLFTAKTKDVKDIEKTGQRLLEEDPLLSIRYTKDMGKEMDHMLESLDLVIVVLITAAALLAFVVLYNLNTINISERRRELATIKVLGFYDMEVGAYVYRENIILTIVGILAGIGIGIFLHQYIVQTAEVEYVMFGRRMKAASYIYSILFTFAFSFFVNFVMFFKLRKIDMVESLKSNE
ncbi:putative ABC transport system permease protein [Aequitasia blattaphilus]|uniref:FtsX-like permease family protein n=1 Tax=Aequitasia blattaphilus TaxID=2949332 RepID=A0ABT1EA91_9FIRM|nr:FtsX-like permease family protein [Aequitasia blattaphilus]MCP1102723.1 FtsX-like permease family protein [Aequitasia blattaphilus]MCR8615363.1 FtsX-like permease family protein [Aequitasia blattaphilus]